MEEKISAIKAQFAKATKTKQPLQVIGGDSKAFLGRRIAGSPIHMSEYKGIICYEPTELYLTVRAGTLLSEVNNALACHRQMLAFEPAQINENTTIGGVIATGLSGPRRAFSGAVRDYVLGIRCLNGFGQELTFGGQVMKNVAGYDLSRLMTGAYGTLGVILDVTLKVVPLPEVEKTCVGNMPLDKALTKMLGLSAQAIPVSASCYDGETLFIRLSGNESAVKEATQKIGLDEYAEGKMFWDALRDYKSPIFNFDMNVWRLSVPQTAELELGGDPFWVDWGGGLYWLNTRRPAAEIFAMASDVGGNAMLFRGNDASQDVFQPLDEGVLKIHKGLKKAFDPHGILNPGKMYSSV